MLNCILILCAALAPSAISGLTILGARGGSVSLPCTYDIISHGKLNTCWQKGKCEKYTLGCYDILIKTDGTQVTERSSNQYRLHHDLEKGNVSLIIDHLMKEHEGEYCCRVEIPGLGNDQFTSITLKTEQDKTCSNCSKDRDLYIKERSFALNQTIEILQYTLGNFTTAETKENKGGQQKQLAKILQDIENKAWSYAVSRLTSNEMDVSFSANEMEMHARAVPAHTSFHDENITLRTESVMMHIKKKTITDGVEKDVLPVAVLISYHAYQLQSIFSGGHLDGKRITNVFYDVNSKIIAATISNKNKHNLTDPISLTFLINKTGEDTMKQPTCAFWKINESYWSAEGCFLVNENTNRTHVTCACNHLSNFAVLVAKADVDGKVLDIISNTGLTLSVISLIISILTFLFCQSAKNQNTALLLKLCISLLIGDIIFLFGISQTNSKNLCRIIAILLHYFFLSSFFWMFLGALQLYLMAQNLKKIRPLHKHIIRRKYMYPLGYAVPALIVGISVAVSVDGYGTDKICWLSHKNGFRWCFIGPMCFIILVNLILFFRTMFILKENISSIDKDISTIKNTKVLLFKAAAQFLVLGITWIIGVLHFEGVVHVTSYLFTILNSFHGVFMFLLYCVANGRVRNDYKVWFRRLCRKQTKEKAPDTATTAIASSSPTETTLPRDWTNTAIPVYKGKDKHNEVEQCTLEWIKGSGRIEDEDDEK